jgi:uncharacterized membrane protein
MSRVQSVWPTLRLGAILTAWKLYRSDWFTWSLAMLVSLVGIGLLQGAFLLLLKVTGLGIFGGLVGLGHPVGVVYANILVGIVVYGLFLGGMMRMAVRQIRGRRPRLEDLFDISDVWLDLLLGSVVVGLPVLIGWQLLVIPGWIAAGLLMFTFPLIVDGGLPATAAARQSFEALRSQWVLAAVTHLVIAAVAGSGALLLGIGLLVTGPLYVLSIAVLYTEMFLDPLAPIWRKPHGVFEDEW